MKLLYWLFSLTDRHSRSIFKYERGGIGRRIAALVTGFIWIALLFLCEYGFLYVLHNYPSSSGSDWTAHIVYLLFLGAFSIGMLPMVVDYCVCFSYVGFKMAILGRILNPRQCERLERRHKYDVNREIRKFRIIDLIFGFVFLLLIAGTVIMFFALLLNYGKYFPSKF